MTVFDTTGMGAQGGTNVSPTAGVASGGDTTASAISAIANVGMQAYGAYKKNEAVEADAAATKEEDLMFSKAAAKHKTINDALAREEYTQYEAKRLKDEIYTSLLIAGGPESRVKALKGIAYGNEGDLISEERRTENTLIKAATDGGYIQSGMNREQKVIQANNYAESRRYLKEMAIMRDEQATATGAIALGKTQRVAAQTQALIGFTKTQYVRIEGDVEQVLTTLREQNHTPEAASAATLMLESMKAKLTSQLTLDGMEAPDTVKAASTALFTRINLAQEMVDGKHTTDAYNNRVANIQGFTEASLLVDHKVSTLSTLQKLLPTSTFVGKAMTNAMKAWTRMTESEDFGSATMSVLPSGKQRKNAPEDVEEIVEYIDSVKAATKVAIDGKGQTPEENESIKAMTGTQVNGILKSVATHNSGDPKEMVEAVDYFASKEYLAARKGLPTYIKPELAKSAQDALVSHTRATISAITNRYNTGKVGTRNVQDLFIPVPRFDGNVVTLTLRPRENHNFNQAQVGEWREHEQKLSKVLGTLVMSGAHLEGHDNYKSYYESVFTSLFGEEVDDKAKQ